MLASLSGNPIHMSHHYWRIGCSASGIFGAVSHMRTVK